MKDELSQDARTLLDAARASFTPGAPRIAAVRAAIDARLAAPAAQNSQGSLPAGAGSTLTGGAAPYLLALGLFAALSVAGGAAVIAGRRHPPAATVPTLAAPAPVEPDLRIASPANEPPAPAPAPSPPTVNAEQLPAVAFSAPSSGLPARSPLRAHASKKDSVPVVAPVESPAPASAPPEPEDSLAREVSLLRAARAALDGGDAQRALALLGRHAQLWPGGVLAEERLATQVLALCALGRVADARAAAQDLETVAPESPHLARVRASCVRRPAPAAGP
jgi:hypothetical protein